VGAILEQQLVVLESLVTSSSAGAAVELAGQAGKAIMRDLLGLYTKEEFPVRRMRFV
jgi:hypothetical protein